MELWLGDGEAGGSRMRGGYSYCDHVPTLVDWWDVNVYIRGGRVYKSEAFSGSLRYLPSCPELDWKQVKMFFALGGVSVPRGRIPNSHS